MLGLACMLVASILARSRAFASLGKLSRRTSPLVSAFSLRADSRELARRKPFTLSALFMSALASDAAVKTKAEPVEYFRKDYVAPNYLIPEVFMEFKLNPTSTHVVTTSKIHRTTPSVEDLILDGEELKLLGVKVNGEPVTAYELSPGKLRIKKEVMPSEDFSLEVSASTLSNTQALMRCA